jgi:hypothetical protein
MKTPTKPFALCIDDTDYQASPIPGKVYRILPDPVAAKDDLVRIVDGEWRGLPLSQKLFLVCGFSPQREEKDSRLGGRRLTIPHTRPIATGGVL